MTSCPSFLQDAELAAWLKKSETLEKILSKRATVVLPSDDPLGALLDEIELSGLAPRKAARAADVTHARKVTGCGATPAASISSRSPRQRRALSLTSRLATKHIT